MTQRTGAGSRTVARRGEWAAGVASEPSKRDLQKVPRVHHVKTVSHSLKAKINRLLNAKINRLLNGKAKVNRRRSDRYAVITWGGRIVSQPEFSRDNNLKATRGQLRAPAGVLSDVSATPALGEAAFEPSARARALLEGIRIRDEDLRAAGGAYSLPEVQILLHGVSRQAVDKRVKEGSLLAVPGPSNRRSFPTLQFNDDGSIVAGLKDVLRVLPTRNPWTVLNFLVRPDDRLDDRKPIDVLKAGEPALAVEAARRVAQQGA